MVISVKITGLMHAFKRGVWSLGICILDLKEYTRFASRRELSIQSVRDVDHVQNALHT